jgi:hypothetical protein
LLRLPKVATRGVAPEFRGLRERGGMAQNRC